MILWDKTMWDPYDCDEIEKTAKFLENMRAIHKNFIEIIMKIKLKTLHWADWVCYEH